MLASARLCSVHRLLLAHQVTPASSIHEVPYIHDDGAKATSSKAGASAIQSWKENAHGRYISDIHNEFRSNSRACRTMK
eukprot:6167272-Amphidinium_carterae.2